MPASANGISICIHSNCLAFLKRVWNISRSDGAEHDEIRHSAAGNGQHLRAVSVPDDNVALSALVHRTLPAWTLSRTYAEGGH
jgi:hypothetical protein